VLPHQQRVVDEKAELDEKLTKLVAFFDNPLWSNLAHDEQARLSRQSEVMREYSDILGKRIAAFNLN
jgi:hypothetical protein